jgi:hypothetical protein
MKEILGRAFAYLAMLILCTVLAACELLTPTRAPATQTRRPPSTATRPSALASSATTVPPSSTTEASPAPSATGTLTPKPTRRPTSTLRVSPAAAGAATAELARPPTSAPQDTGVPSQTIQGNTRHVTIGGDPQGLQRDGQYVWDAVGVECLDAAGKVLARLSVKALEDDYRVPVGTRRVTLWIGRELGGADWWKAWDCQPVDASQPAMILVVQPLTTPTSPKQPTPERPTQAVSPTLPKPPTPIPTPIPAPYPTWWHPAC